MRGTRWPVLGVSLCLAAVAALSIPACKKKSDGQQVASARRTLEEIEVNVGKVQKATADVRARLSALPEDLPGLETVRSKLFAMEEVLGVDNGRIQWLSGELDAAVAAGDQAKIQQVSETIRNFLEGSKTMGTPVVALSHELMPFERTAAQIRALVDAGVLFVHRLPTGFELKGANEGLEEQLVDVVAGRRKADKKTWITFDRLKSHGNDAQVDVEQLAEQVENVAAIMKAHPLLKLEVGGFTDNTGPAAASKKTSGERAQVVKDLIIKAGIDPSRLTSAGYGPANPVCAANDTEDCKAQNRRIAVRVTAR